MPSSWNRETVPRTPLRLYPRRVGDYDDFRISGVDTSPQAPSKAKKPPRASRTPRGQRGGVVTAPRVWPILAAVSLVSSILLSVIFGVSYLTFGLSLLSCVLVVLAMLVDRTRSQDKRYSFEPWFVRLTSSMYLGGTLFSLTQIVLVAIEAAR